MVKRLRKFIPMRITQDFTGERFNEDAMVLDDKTVDELLRVLLTNLVRQSRIKKTKTI